VAESFSVGEIALGTGFVDYPEFNGMECEVLSERWLPLACVRRCDGQPLSISWCYEVRWAGGLTDQVREQNLRKRRPPQDWVKLCHLTDASRELETV
jgi:hypothetical protein